MVKDKIYKKIKLKLNILIFCLFINTSFSNYNLLLKGFIISEIQNIEYHLITGTFKNGFDAWDNVIKLKKLGYKNAKILPKQNELFKVSAGSFNNYNSALEIQKKIFLDGFKNTKIEEYNSNEIVEKDNIIDDEIDKTTDIEKVLDEDMIIKNENIEKDTIPKIKKDEKINKKGDYYEVIVGTYSNGFSAWDRVNKLKNLGFESSKILSKENNLFRVSVQEFQDLNDIKKVYKDLKANQINQFNVIKFINSASNEIIEEPIDVKNILAEVDKASEIIKEDFIEEEVAQIEEVSEEDEIETKIVSNEIVEKDNIIDDEIDKTTDIEKVLDKDMIIENKNIEKDTIPKIKKDEKINKKGDYYEVIVGAYSNGFSAWDRVNKLKNLGFESSKILIKENNLFRVSVGNLQDLNDIKKVYKDLKANQINRFNVIKFINSASNEIIEEPIDVKNILAEVDKASEIIKEDFIEEEVAQIEEVSEEDEIETKIVSNEIVEKDNIIDDEIDKTTDIEKVLDEDMIIKNENIEKDTIPKIKKDEKINKKGDYYEVIVGTYSNGFSAWDRVNKLKNLGFESSKILSKENNLFRVSVQEFQDLNDIKKVYKDLKANQINQFNVIKFINSASNEIIEEPIDVKNILAEVDKASEIIKEDFIEEEVAQIEEVSEEDEIETKIVSNEIFQNDIKEEKEQISKIIDQENKVEEEKINNNLNSELSLNETISENSIASKSDIIEPEDNNLIEASIISENKTKEIKSNRKRKEKKKKSGLNIFSALKDYNRKAYSSALEKYLILANSGRETYEIFDYIANSYFNNSQYDKAVIWFNKLITKYPKKVTAENYFRASLSFKSQGAYNVSEQLLKSYIEKTSDLIVKTYYYENPNYLDEIIKNSILFDIEKTNINTENSDFGPGFFGEDKLIYSSSKNSTGNDLYEWTDEPFLDLFVSDIDSLGDLGEPNKISGDINTPFHESSAILSRDKKTMYFTRNNFYKGDLSFDKNKQVNLKIYKAQSEDGETWTNIQELPFNDDEYSTAHPAFSVDEKRLYFSSDRPGSFGYSDIWYVDILEDDEYGDPANLGPNVNTEFRESFPYISDNNILYFSSDGRMGLGGFDIYFSNLDAYASPEKAKNFGEPLNSRMDDFGFIYNSEKNLGYFSSNRGGYNGSKSDEVYKVKMLGSSSCGSMLTGTVRDKNTEKLLPWTKVELQDNFGNMISSQIVKDDAKYDFSKEIDCSKCYIIKATKGVGYSSFEKIVCIPESSTKLVNNIDLDWAKDCLPDDFECLFNINPIYFDLDKYYIRRDAVKELKKVYTVMIRYPNLKIHIESHTDSRASNKYNLGLSYNRAKSTQAWLVKRGIEEKRISISALGEMDLDNYCEDNIDCQEQEHQMNRRSIFKIRDY